MYFNQRGDISTLKGGALKLVDKFSSLGSSVSSTETDINTPLAKAWIAIDRLSVIWKLDLTDKIKRSFFQAAVVSILLYRCTYKRMLRATLNKSWGQHLTKQQLYGHLPPITKTFKVRRTRHTGHCWRSRNELIGDILLWTPSYGRAKAGQLARSYMQLLCGDTVCSLEDLPGAMDDSDRWRVRVGEIRAGGVT